MLVVRIPRRPSTFYVVGGVAAGRAAVSTRIPARSRKTSTSLEWLPIQWPGRTYGRHERAATRGGSGGSTPHGRGGTSHGQGVSRECGCDCCESGTSRRPRTPVRWWYVGLCPLASLRPRQRDDDVQAVRSDGGTVTDPSGPDAVPADPSVPDDSTDEATARRHVGVGLTGGLTPCSPRGPR